MANPEAGEQDATGPIVASLEQALQHDVAVLTKGFALLQGQMQELLFRLPPPSSDTAHLMCPAGHLLIAFKAVAPMLICDLCDVAQPTGAALRGCRACQYDVCEVCVARGEEGAISIATVDAFQGRAEEAEQLEDLATVAAVRALRDIPEGARALLDADALAEVEKGMGITSDVINRATLTALGVQTPAGVRDDRVRKFVEGGADVYALGLADCVAITDSAIRAVGNHCSTLEYILLDGTNIKDEALNALALGCPNLRALSLRDCLGVMDEGAICIAEGCLKLEQIILDRTSVTDRALEAFGRGCWKIRSFSVTGCVRVTDTGVLHVAQRCKYLQGVNLDGTSVTDMALEALGNSCPILTTLSVKGVAHVTNAGVLSLAQGCPKLEVIILDGTSVTDEGVEALAKFCPSLRELVLDGCSKVSDAGVLHVAQGCPRLEHIDLDGTSAADAALEALGKGCPGLQGLILTRCEEVTDDGVLHIAQGCPGLERIYLDDTSVTDDALEALGESCPSLRELCLGNCTEVTDDGVLRVAHGCPCLERVDLDGTSVTDEALAALGRGCLGLHTLFLQGCAGVTDAGVLHIAQGCSKLVHITLDSTSVTDRALEALGKGCPSLRVLFLKACTQVTDDGVLHVAQGCPMLEHIHLDDTSAADGALEALGQGCPGLRNLHLRGCARVTNAGVLKVAQGCLNLVQISLDGTAVADEGVAALAQHCPHLMHVDLDCTGVADRGLSLLAKQCHDLEHIFLSNCSMVTDVGARQLLRSSLHLKRVSFGNCMKVTDASIDFLPEQLLVINLEGSGVTGGGAAALAKRYPHVLVIHRGAFGPRVPEPQARPPLLALRGLLALALPVLMAFLLELPSTS